MTMKILPWIGTACLLVSSALADSGVSGLTALAGTSTYEFAVGASTIIQTGGFAGMHRVYHIKGRFVLTVDPNAGTAFFDRVDANAINDGPFGHDLDPDEIFDMTGLTGTVAEDGSIRFESTSRDGSSILITAVFVETTIHLRGETVPPPQSADFFVYELDAAATRRYAGGTGEPNNPYRICTVEQMNALGAEPNDWDQHFQLTADIDLSACGAKQSNIIGSEATPFTGVFRGNGHLIISFSHAQTDANNIALFGYVDDPNARIEALGLVNPTIDAGKKGNSGSLVGFLKQGTVAACFARDGSVGGGSNIGGLIGVSKGLITDCHSTVKVLGSAGVGGLVGINTGNVTRCHAEADVSGYIFVGGLVGFNDTIIADSYAAGDIVGSQGVGGLTGDNGLFASVRNCYARGSVAGSWRVGGLAGYNAGEISYSYASGLVAGDHYVGGLIGQVSGGSAFACFWDVQTSGQTFSAGGMGKTTDEMHRADTFLAAGWDFVDEMANGTQDLWWIQEGQDYPRLAWERLLNDNSEKPVSLE